jgi:RNA polymerase sigma-70 factor (ECF subfamily)
MPLIAVLARLDGYRGESRFTTWAWKFAFYQACVAIRRRRWLGREIPVDATGWEALSARTTVEGQVEQAELIEALQSAVERALTPHQRRVFVALALNEVPVDVLAERLGTSRGALYKALHESRARLRADLAASGLGPERWRPTRPDKGEGLTRFRRRVTPSQAAPPLSESEYAHDLPVA